MSVPIDSAWRAAHPLPGIASGLDKEERGRVVLVGGSSTVPGAVLLTGEAVLRAGAGKVQIGTVAAAALAIGIAFPEAAVIALETNDDGELVPGVGQRMGDLTACDALLIGPGMVRQPNTGQLLGELLDLITGDTPVLLDAGAITALRDCPAQVIERPVPIVVTPHHGELASLMNIEKSSITQDPALAAIKAARRFGAIVVLKDAETFIADPAGQLFSYTSEAPGLGTAGSGDVLAGIIGGLLARGVDPCVAAGHGVWMHGRAGCAAAAEIGEIGYLARDLLRFVPAMALTDDRFAD